MFRGEKRGGEQTGFTLVELMITVAIIGILAAIAVPNYLQFLVKSKRAEAVEALGTVYTAQVSFKASNDYFTLSMHQLGISMGAGPTPGNLNCIEGSLVVCGKYYAVWNTEASINTFAATAAGFPDPNGGLDEYFVHHPPP